MTDTGGDCFEVAGRAAIDPANPLNAHPDFRVVHAFVSGQGALAGRRFEHAWVEIQDRVFDFANGKAILLPRGEYYHIGEIINPRRYTAAEARDHMMETEHFGPWEELTP